MNSTENAEPVVVFKNGASVSLSNALADRKKIWVGPLSAEMLIKESSFIQLDGIDCIAIVAENDKVIEFPIYACNRHYFFIIFFFPLLFCRD